MAKLFHSRFVLAGLLLLSAVPFCEAQNDERRVRVWADRAIETVAQIAADPTTEKFHVDYYVGMVTLALGQNGLTKDAIKLIDRLGLKKGPARDMALMSLADGLSLADFVAEALLKSDEIGNENLRAMSFRIVAIRQSQKGDFGDAVKLLERIPDQKNRDRAIAQICEEYVNVARFDEARSLSSQITDANTQSEVVDKIDKRKAMPTVLNGNYVSEKLNSAKEGVFGGASDDQLAFLEHYYRAEVALASKDVRQFEAEAGIARKLALESTENNDLLLVLARLMYKSENLEQAQTLFSQLLNNYSKQKGNPPALDFNMIMFGSGPKSDAWMVAKCVPEVKIKEFLEKLSKQDSIRSTVAAPIFGETVHHSNPDWAEVLYRDATRIRIKAEYAISCLIAFAQDP